MHLFAELDLVAECSLRVRGKDDKSSENISSYSFTRFSEISPLNFQIAAKHGITPLAVVIRWTLHHGVSAIPRSGNAEHIRENFREVALAQQKG